MATTQTSPLTALAPPKTEVLGVGISATSYDEVVHVCSAWISQRRNGHNVPAKYICATSVHGVMEARKNEQIREVLNQADIATPDGMPLVWALRSFGMEEQQRVYGPTLMLKLLEQAERAGHRIFLYGGRTDTLQTLCDKLQERFPKLIVAGKYSPPFRPLNAQEEWQVRRMVEDSRADLLFVGVSTPKQERWMADHKDCFPGLIMVGVGAAFDFHAGRVSQAPAWMQARGLEWLYRLVSEPGRLWKRYLLVTPWFLPFWALQKMSLSMHAAACGYHRRGARTNVAAN